MPKSDILLFMSDQHAPQFMQGAEVDVDTPNLAAMKQEGVTFQEAYTPCPLCVPARMSMLSGKRASRTGVFTNTDTLSNTEPTFLHELTAAGYETVLAGRMHFIGVDQRHGFTKRIAPDMTPVTWSRPAEQLRQERGVFSRTFAGTWAPQVVGGGESPVLHYDDMVIRTVLEYLEQPHEKPQFIVVGTYGPHFPYVAPPKLFEKYWKRVRAPKLHCMVPEYMNPCLLGHRVETSEDVVRGAMAAYCGMIERMDGQIGRVREAFDRFVRRRGTKKIFAYLSDHGDQVGERDLFGKETFFEKSVKIPMIFTGDGISAGVSVTGPVSLLDLGPTVCELGEAGTPRGSDGISLVRQLRGETVDQDRVVFSEFMEKNPEGNWRYSLMLRQGRWKYITYHGYEDQDMLFNISTDPLEEKNLAETDFERLEYFRELADAEAPDMEALELIQAERAYSTKLFSAWEEAAGTEEHERWKENPPSARENPQICIAGL